MEYRRLKIFEYHIFFNLNREIRGAYCLFIFYVFMEWNRNKCATEEALEGRVTDVSSF